MRGWRIGFGICVLLVAIQAALPALADDPVAIDNSYQDPTAESGDQYADEAVYLGFDAAVVSPPAVQAECSLLVDPVWAWTATCTSSPPGALVQLDTLSDDDFAEVSLTGDTPGSYTVEVTSTVTYTTSCGGAATISGTGTATVYLNCPTCP